MVLSSVRGTYEVISRLHMSASDAQLRRQILDILRHHIPLLIGGSSRASGAARIRWAAGRTPSSARTSAHSPDRRCAPPPSSPAPGSMSSSFATPRYVSGSGLKWRNRSEPKIMSHGMPACFAMLSSSDTLPLDSGPMMKLRFSRVRPGTESGHGFSRCQPRLMCRRSASVRPRDAELRHQLVERRAVQVVERGPRLLALAHAVHRRVVGRAPGIHQRGPVGVDAALPAERGQLGDQAAAPVHHGAERVEHDRDRLLCCHGVPPVVRGQRSLRRQRGQAS